MSAAAEASLLTNRPREQRGQVTTREAIYREYFPRHLQGSGHSGFPPGRAPCHGVSPHNCFSPFEIMRWDSATMCSADGRVAQECYPLNAFNGGTLSNKTRRLVFSEQKWIERLLCFLPCSGHRKTFSPSPSSALFRRKRFAAPLGGVKFRRHAVVGNANMCRQRKSTNFRTGSDGCPLVFVPVKFLMKKPTEGFCQGRGERGMDVAVSSFCFSCVTKHQFIKPGVPTKERACGLMTSDMIKERREPYFCIFALIFLPTSFINTNVATSSRPPSNSLEMLLRTHCQMH